MKEIHSFINIKTVYTGDIRYFIMRIYHSQIPLDYVNANEHTIYDKFVQSFKFNESKKKFKRLNTALDGLLQADNYISGPYLVFLDDKYHKILSKL